MRASFHNMKTEFEVEILDIDVEEMQRRLDEIGAVNY